MTTVKIGDRVRVHYTGRLDDGEVFDSSDGGTPLAFTVGDGQVIPGFENGVIGMAAGDTRTIHIPSEQAYGDHDAEGIMEVPRSEFPPEFELEPGSRVQGQQSDGTMVSFTIAAVADDIITLDANHPLAGKALTFDLTLVSIGE